MIVFYGELSEKSKKFIQKDATKMGRFIVSIVIALFSIPAIMATIMWHWIFAITIPFPIIIALLVLIPQINSPMKVLELFFPSKIIFEGEIVDKECKKKFQSKRVMDVKKVVDMGECYYIIFCFPHKDPYYLCQKNLITKGTIEEFEALFQDKILRKIK